MNALRKAGLLAVVALAAMFLVGMTADSAEAGCHSFNYGGYGLYSTSYAPLACATPVYTTQLYYYPVTVYDYYGNPVTIWKTGYKKVLLRY